MKRYNTNIPQILFEKLNNKCNINFATFQEITIQNIQYSALQFTAPTLKEEVKDLSDYKAVSEFFAREENKECMVNAFDYLTKNNHLTPIGYLQAYNEKKEFLGIGGHFVDEIKNGKITKLQRGIHVRQDFKDPKNPKPVIMGAVLMWHFLDHLEKNKEYLDYDGVLLSSILVTNGRMIDFGLRHKLNVGDYKPNKERGTLEYRQPIGEYMGRMSEMKGSLEVSINKFHNPSRSVSNVSFENNIENYK